MELYKWIIWFTLCFILCGWVVIFNGAETIEKWSSIMKKIMPWASTIEKEGIRFIFLLLWPIITIFFIVGIISSELRAIF